MTDVESTTQLRSTTYIINATVRARLLAEPKPVDRCRGKAARQPRYLHYSVYRYLYLHVLSRVVFMLEFLDSFHY